MRFLIAFLIALVIGEDSSADEPRVVVENKIPPAVVVVNKSAPVVPAAAVVCGPTGCQLVAPAQSAGETVVSRSKETVRRVGVFQAGSVPPRFTTRWGWYLGKRLGR